MFHGMSNMARKVLGAVGNGHAVVAQYATAMPYCLSRSPSCGGAVRSTVQNASVWHPAVIGSKAAMAAMAVAWAAVICGKFMCCN
jgi:hypothetical protein